MRRMLYFLFLSLLTPVFAFGDCVVTSDLDDKFYNEEIYPDIVNTTSAYVCNEDNSCAAGDVLVLNKDAYTGDGNGKRKNISVISGPRVYWCDDDGDDEWIEAGTSVGNISDCTATAGLYYTGVATGDDGSYFLWGDKGPNDSFRNVCKVRGDTIFDGDFICKKDRIDKTYVYKDNNSQNAFKKCHEGHWIDSDEKNIGLCSGKPDSSDYDALWPVDTNNGSRIFIKKSATPADANSTDVYEFWDNNPNFCLWCEDGMFGLLTNDGFVCAGSQEEYDCRNAIQNDELDAKWEDGECKCNGDAEWDDNRHTCNQKKSDVLCDEDKKNKEYVFMEDDRAYLPWKCTEKGKWKQQNTPLVNCYSIDDTNKVEQFSPDDSFIAGSGTDYNAYVKQDTETVADNVYGYVKDKTIMCMWCAEGKYVSFNEEGKLGCHDNEEQAWCLFEKHKNKLNVDWAGDKCLCKENGVSWDKDTHMCINPECLKYDDNSEAKKCCMKGSNVAVWDDKGDRCICKQEAYEWKNSNCELNKEKKKEIVNAKEKVNSFFESASKNASVWKDAEGNFNSARLASDLTAGVVLGTVGGVVSGVVIKKKQIEKGFEVLHCDVGGQKMANWGDEFRIGLQSKY